jgi:pimeloyl-ACP methyl ester carboxylesterase
MLQGTLFRYGKGSANVAFKAGGGVSGKKPNDNNPSARHQCAVFVGGLTDGLFACGYCEPLSVKLGERGVSLVQTLLSSSHQGYGTSSLDKDAQELEELCRFLKDHFGCKQYALIGHSTGCQDSVRFVKRLKESEQGRQILPSCVVLQAPVSDRESLDLHPSTWKNRERAKEMIENGEGRALMPYDTQEDGAPITAERYYSLTSELGDDDCFSSDLSDDQLGQLLQHMDGVPTLVLQSGSDEYIPRTVDADQTAERLARAMGSQARYLTVEGGSHALNDHTEEAVQLISDFILRTLQPGEE